MWAKLTELVKRKPAAATSAAAGQKSAAAAPAAAAATGTGRIGPTGVALPPSSRPLVSYMGSPYGVAPDFVTNYPANIGAPLDINELAAHIERLSAPVGEPYGIVQFDGFDVEFKHLEHLESLRDPAAADYSAAVSEANMLKNRYGNILPPEHTRVRLELRDNAPNSDFINANFVDGLCSPKRYIATQGPLPNTFDDFWRLVWEQEIAVVLMLTREIESGVIKCARYWPEPDDDDDDDSSSSSSQQKNNSGTSNGIKMDTDKNNNNNNDDDDNDSSNSDGKAKASSSSPPPPKQAAPGMALPATSSTLMSDLALVTFDGLPEVEPVGDGEEDPRQTCYGDVRVLFRGKRPGDEFVVRQFDLRRGGVVRHLTMLQYTGWPDHGVPASPQGFVTLSRLADLANKLNARANAKLARKREVKKPLAPLLTHCSAGVGRTGTFITIHSLLERVKAAPHERVSVHQTLYNIRTARPNSVQTKDQYRFCYVSLADQIRHLQAEIVANEEAKAAKRAAYRAKKKQRLEAPRDAARSSPRSHSRSHGGSRTTSPRHGSRSANGRSRHGGHRSRASRRSSHN